MNEFCQVMINSISFIRQIISKKRKNKRVTVIQDRFAIFMNETIVIHVPFIIMHVK